MAAGEAAQVVEDRGDDPLRHGGRARVAGVAERDAVGHVRLDPVDPGGEDLHDPQVRQAAERLGHLAMEVGDRELRALRGEDDVVGQAAAGEILGDEDLHPMNEPRTESPAGPATAPSASSRSISSGA